MTEFNPSLAPRKKIKSNFLPLRPIFPSARARLTMSGMSTSVERATPRPTLKERSKNARRVRMSKFFCIGLLVLEALETHQHRHHAADAEVVGGIVYEQRTEGGERGCRAIGEAVAQVIDGSVAG